MEKITCEECYKDYDDSHLEGFEMPEKIDAAKFDGWKFGFFTSCPECQEKAEEENNR